MRILQNLTRSTKKSYQPDSTLGEAIKNVIEGGQMPHAEKNKIFLTQKNEHGETPLDTYFNKSRSFYFYKKTGDDPFKINTLTQPELVAETENNKTQTANNIKTTEQSSIKLIEPELIVNLNNNAVDTNIQEIVEEMKNEIGLNVFFDLNRIKKIDWSLYGIDIEYLLKNIRIQGANQLRTYTHSYEDEHGETVVENISYYVKGHQKIFLTLIKHVLLVEDEKNLNTALEKVKDLMQKSCKLWINNRSWDSENRKQNYQIQNKIYPITEVLDRYFNYFDEGKITPSNEEKIEHIVSSLKKIPNKKVQKQCIFHLLEHFSEFVEPSAIDLHRVVEMLELTDDPKFKNRFVDSNMGLDLKQEYEKVQSKYSDAAKKFMEAVLNRYDRTVRDSGDIAKRQSYYSDVYGLNKVEKQRSPSFVTTYSTEDVFDELNTLFNFYGIK